MTGALVTVALILGALFLTLLAPRLLARWTLPRQSPGAGLFLWQALSLSGVACALLATPVAALTFGTRYPSLFGVALAVSGLMLVGILWSGHRIGSDLRRMRAEHRALVDLVGDRLETSQGTRSAVIAHGSPTAYCLPGRHDRIVLSQAAVDRLTPDELTAVLEHERAHLRARHDLLLELFTVLHSSVPEAIRSPEALREVHLLVEALADRMARRTVGATTLARALVAMAAPAGASTDPANSTASHEQAIPSVSDLGQHSPALAAIGGTEQVRVRLELLAGRDSRPWLRGTLVTIGALTLLLPWSLALSQV